MLKAPKGPWLRAVLVAALAATGLAISLPNAYASIYKTVGTFDFSTCDGVVCDVEGEAQKAGIRVGDRLNLRAPMARDWNPDILWDKPTPPGLTVSFPLERGSTKYTATLTARRDDSERTGLDLLVVLAGKVAAIVLVVIVSALFLIRPTPLSGSLALSTLGSFALGPEFYTFLSGGAFLALIILTEAIFFAAGTVGDLALALSLGRDWRPWYPRLLLVLFGILVVPLTVLQIRHYLGLPTITLYTVTYLGLALFGIAAMSILIGTALRRAARPSERFAAGLLAVATVGSLFQRFQQVFGMLTLARRVTLPSQILSGGELGLDLAQMAGLLGFAAVVYVIVRDRMVDSGLITSRILGYGAILLAILAAFGLLNWAFAANLAAYPFAIPLEIFAAVGVGYWFSGFRDVSGALSLAAIDAPAAAMNGRPLDEHDALARAFGLAERTRQPSLIAEVHARCAFSAWVNGDDLNFERNAHALNAVLGSRSLRGVRTFSRAANAQESAVESDPSDLPEWRARASLIRCATSENAQHAGEYALDAVRGADQADQPWLRILARVALAESVSGERVARLNEAAAIARSAGSLLVVKSLAALRADKRDIGMLQAFVDVRMRKVRPACPAVEIAFFTGDVRVMGRSVELPDKERALLFTVAESKGPTNGDALADALWPESDGDAARNSLSVCLHRLRRHAGDARIVQHVGQGYALHPDAEVDLWRLEAALKTGEEEQIAVLRESLRDGATRRAALGSWFAPFEIQLAQKLKELDRRPASRAAPRTNDVQPTGSAADSA